MLNPCADISIVLYRTTCDERFSSAAPYGRKPSGKDACSAGVHAPPFSLTVGLDP